MLFRYVEIGNTIQLYTLFETMRLAQWSAACQVVSKITSLEHPLAFNQKQVTEKLRCRLRTAHKRHP